MHGQWCPPWWSFLARPSVKFWRFPRMTEQCPSACHTLGDQRTRWFVGTKGVPLFLALIYFSRDNLFHHIPFRVFPLRRFLDLIVDAFSFQCRFGIPNPLRCNDIAWSKRPRGLERLFRRLKGLPKDIQLTTIKNWKNIFFSLKGFLVFWFFWNVEFTFVARSFMPRLFAHCAAWFIFAVKSIVPILPTFGTRYYWFINMLVLVKEFTFQPAQYTFLGRYVFSGIGSMYKKRLPFSILVIFFWFQDF